MLYRDICKVLGLYFFGLSAALAFPLALAFYHQWVDSPATHPQPHSTWAFFWTIAICLSIAAILWMFGRNSSAQIYRREGIITVVLVWILTPAIASLPFLFSHTLTNPFQVYFEMASGFTTTGSTVLFPKKYDLLTGEEIPYVRHFPGIQNQTYRFWGTVDPVRDPLTGHILHEGIEAVGQALLFWRSMTQWLGGMGIIVLFVAILPVLGVGGKTLFHAEVPGPLKESLTPRIKDAAIQLWKIYLGITLLEVVALLFAGLSPLAAITMTFSTLATGGFCIKNDSIAGFHNVMAEWIVIVFMILSSINFSLYFFALQGKIYRFYQPEFFLYMIVLLVTCTIASLSLVGEPLQVLGSSTLAPFTKAEAIRHGTFQVISAQTTTGFATANYDLWPFAVQALMLIVMYAGGMSGSTSGGIKMMRHYMLFRIVQYKVESLFRPETVRRFRVGDREIDPNSAMMVLCFFVVIIAVAVLSTYLFILDGVDPETALGVVASSINNVGFAFRMAGPTESCAFLSNTGLVLGSILMIMGRLEFFAVLALLVPAFWKQTR